MGGCASKPRELNTKQEEAPLPDDRDVPAAATTAPNESDVVPQEEGNAGEANKKEEDDISKPAAEEPSAESKPVELEEAEPSEEPTAAVVKAEPAPAPAPATAPAPAPAPTPTPAPAEEARAPSPEIKSDATLVTV